MIYDNPPDPNEDPSHPLYDLVGLCSFLGKEKLSDLTTQDLMYAEICDAHRKGYTLEELFQLWGDELSEQEKKWEREVYQLENEGYYPPIPHINNNDN